MSGNSKIIMALAIYLASFTVLINAQSGHVHVNNDYMVSYEMKNDSRMHFTIEANVNGWVAIGINDKGSMPGADIFMGGVFSNGTGYGNDYHVPSNATDDSFAPKLDVKQDWTIDTYSREGKKLVFKVNRALNTSDADEDRVIEDKDMYLLLAYNTESNDLGDKHNDTTRSAHRINLLSSGASATFLGATTLLFGLLAALIRS